MSNLKEKFKILAIGFISSLICLILQILFLNHKFTFALFTWLNTIPVTLGFIPFLIKDDKYLNYYLKIIFIPIIIFIIIIVLLKIFIGENFLIYIFLFGPFIIIGLIGALLFITLRMNKNKYI